MRFEYEVQEFAARIKFDLPPEEAQVQVELFRACVPVDFWLVCDQDVTHNRKVWEDFVLPYCEALHVARRRGYGLHLEGDNGVGKTMFAAYVLGCAIRAGYTAYYTTVLDLNFDLRRGLDNREVMERMDQLLEMDFLALDELTKEQYKEGDSWMRTHVERVLKFRHDNNLPTVVAANAGLDQIGEAYGPTVRSVLVGKYQRVLFEPGDFRDRIQKRMRKEMRFRG